MASRRWRDGVGHQFIETQNYLGWKRPLRSPSPTSNLTYRVPSLKHVISSSDKPQERLKQSRVRSKPTKIEFFCAQGRGVDLPRAYRGLRAAGCKAQHEACRERQPMVQPLLSIAAPVTCGNTAGQKDGRCSCFLPKQRRSLISFFSFFPRPILFWARRVHQDTCQICADSGL